MINYKITPNPLAHEWHIRLTFRQEHDLETEISLPNWVPGSYLIRDFSRHITTIRAFCNGEYAHLTQVKKKPMAHRPAVRRVGNLLHRLRLRPVRPRLVSDCRTRVL